MDIVHCCSKLCTTRFVQSTTQCKVRWTLVKHWVDNWTYACVLQWATYIGNNQVQQWVDIICAAGQSLVRGGGYQGGHEGCGGCLRPMALCTMSLCTYSLCICVSVWNAWCAGVWVSGLVEGTHEGRDGLVTHAAHPPLHVRPPWFSKVFGGTDCDTFYWRFT